ncbi:MAG: RNase III inhibitor, partial [Lachnospiraceae bacterium]
MINKKLAEAVERYIDKYYVPEIYEIDESVAQSFHVESRAMASYGAVGRSIDDLMNQMEETFSQRLLRLIDERGMTDSQVYNKAYVDRRHFSKIRNDMDYTPSKKTVLAF